MPTMNDRATIVTTNADSYTSIVTVKGEVQQQFLTDAHPSEGGEGKGATPHELLEAALAGCKTITVQMYAKRKGWPLESVTVRVSHDQRAIEEGGPKRHVFDVEVELTGDLTDEQRQRLHEIAGRCPVHRIVESDPVFESKLVD